MKKISSRSTGFYKKGFPALWFGFLALFLLMAVTQGVIAKGGSVFLLVPCTMGVFGYFIMRRFVWDLVDEVYDCGDSLLIRNRGQEHRVPLTDIMNVNASIAVNPPRITLRLKNVSAAGSLGAEVSFSPQRAFALNPFAKNQVAEDLIVRIDRARSGRAV